MTVRTLRLALAAFVLVWSAAGIARAGYYTWTTAGPEPGTILQIVVDPGKPSSLYSVSSFFGGYLFRTDDRGARWDYVERGAGSHFVVSDPTQSGVLYAPVYPGISKTSDGGRTWRDTSLSGRAVAALALAPSSPSTLYAIVSSLPARVFRSNDGGATFALVSSNLPGSSWTLTVDPANPQVVYAATSPALLKSVDGGATWLPSNAGLPASASFLRIDAGAPATLYAGTTDSGVFRSTDAGATWNPSNAGIADQTIRDIAIDPSDPARIYAASFGASAAAGSGGLYVSGDSGATWLPVDVGLPGPLYGTAITVDAHDSNLLYAGIGTSALRGNVLKSDDRGVTWALANAGLSGYITGALSADPSLASSAWASSGSSVYRTDSGGSSWSLLSSLPYSLTALLSDPSNSSTLYTLFSGISAGGAYKSTDGGATWSDASTGMTAAATFHLAIGRSNTSVLLASTADGVFRTTDGGGSWSSVLAGYGRGVAVDPADSGILYAGLSSQPPQNAFVRSDDGGATWNPPAGLPTPAATAFQIRVDPARADYVYSVVGSHIFRSTDRGLHFSPSEQGIPAIQDDSVPLLAIDPSRTETLYATRTSFGQVVRSTDSAASWAPLSGFIPSLVITDISVSANGRTIYATTESGIFQFERSFLDVSNGSPVWPFVDAAAMTGLTAGCGGGRFCPDVTLTRAQGAVFLLRAAKGAAFAPPPATGTVFSDVPASGFAASWIEELAREEIAAGCGAGAFCPDASLSRAEMAVFLLRAEHGPTFVPPPATGAVFADVPAGAFAAAWIEQLFHEGVTAGCGGGSFCPEASASRVQAVTFLVSAFALR